MVKQLRFLHGSIVIYSLMNELSLLDGSDKEVKLGEWLEKSPAKVAFTGDGDRLFLAFSTGGPEMRYLISLTTGWDETRSIFRVRLFSNHTGFIIRGIYRYRSEELPFTASFSHLLPDGYEVGKVGFV
jgi:hypothetical protein